MNQAIATAVFESLASSIRLDIYRLLVRNAPDGLVAGEISETLELPPNNMSFHLKVLVQASLLTVEQQGRFLRYRANLDLMQQVIAYLTAECCAGQPERCAVPAPRRLQATARVRRGSRVPS